MNRTEYTIPVKLDARTFRRFGSFDMLRLRKKWVRPAVFALILIAFAVIALLTRREQSGLIAAVLLVIGLGLPLVYFGTFFSQVNMQAINYKLKPPRRVYTVRLDQAGIHVSNDQKQEQPVDVAWQDAQAAFHVRGCVYLYINAARAFLLPDGQGNAPAEEIWEYLVKHMGDRCKF